MEEDLREKLDALQGRGPDVEAWKAALGRAGLRVSDWDGFPIKNCLPARLGAEFATLRQWTDEGFYPIIGAKRVEMHPSLGGAKLCEYLHESQVEPMDERAAMRWRVKKAALEDALERFAGPGGLSACGAERDEM